MKAFRIDSDDNITAYPSRELAKAAGDGVFTNADQLVQLLRLATMDRLVAIWNSLPRGVPGKKFENRAKACNRISKVIDGMHLAEPVAEETATVGDTGAKVRAPKAKAARKAKAADGAVPRDNKKAQVIAMMQTQDGVSLQAIMDATGWQKHTVRGFVAGTLGTKMGLKVESFKNAAGERAYRLPQSAAAAS